MRTIAGILGILAVAGCAAQPTATPEPRNVLSLQDVIRLHEAGIASKVVVAKIQASETAVEMPVSRIIELKEKGLPDDVLEALVRSTEKEEPQRIFIRRYGPSYMDPWYYRPPYVY